MEKEDFLMHMGFSDQLNWDQPMEHDPQSESAFSSIVSSPSNPNPSAPNNVVMRELIGRLGNICNSQEIYSANTSCYSSPLNSPSKLGNSWPNHGGLGNPVSRLAQFPSFNGLSENGKLSRVSSSKSLMSGGSQMDGVEKNDRLRYNGGNVRKRKAPSRSKAKDPPKIAKGDSNEKRSKTAGTKIEQTSGDDQKETNPKPPEAPKQDYIHVRARRGQATDSHSLAERVRREKISERMNFLQELVPGCSKMIGKAVVLDEIINYVQSLQRQVEFLSMKLATVNPQMDLNLENLVQKDLSGLLPQLVFPMEGSAPTFPSSQQLSNPQIGVSNRMQSNCALIPLDDAMRRSLNMQMQLPAVDHLADVANMNRTFWEDDLQRIVHPGFVQNLNNQLPHNPSKEHCPQQSPKGNSDGF